MYRMIFTLILTLAVLITCSFGCAPDTDILTPDQIDVSMVDQVVTVKGKITYAVENPMGVGGMYMKLGNSKGEVDVRIQPELWNSYQADEKAIYRQGKTVTVEGILFKAGTDLAVVHGKYTSANTSVTSNSSIR